MTDAPGTAPPPADVAAQHARYDRHADDRVRLSGLAVAALARHAGSAYAGLK